MKDKKFKVKINHKPYGCIFDLVDMESTDWEIVEESPLIDKGVYSIKDEIRSYCHYDIKMALNILLDSIKNEDNVENIKKKAKKIFGEGFINERK